MSDKSAIEAVVIEGLTLAARILVPQTDMPFADAALSVVRSLLAVHDGSISVTDAKTLIDNLKNVYTDNDAMADAYARQILGEPKP